MSTPLPWYIQAPPPPSPPPGTRGNPPPTPPISRACLERVSRSRPTYSQGVQDVRERAVAAGLPRAQADRVWTATFHSFAATVLKQNAHLIW